MGENKWFNLNFLLKFGEIANGYKYLSSILSFILSWTSLMLMLSRIYNFHIGIIIGVYYFDCKKYVAGNRKKMKVVYSHTKMVNSNTSILLKVVKSKKKKYKMNKSLLEVVNSKTMAVNSSTNWNW